MVFLFCATAFGVVLTLGGLRYSTVETEIYLLTTQFLDLQGAAALSVLQVVVVVGAAAARGPRPAARQRAVDRAVQARHAAAPRGAVRRGRARGRRRPLTFVALPIVALVVRSLRVADGWSLEHYRSRRAPTRTSALPTSVLARRRQLLRVAVDATLLAVGLGGLVVGAGDASAAHRRAAPAAPCLRRRLHAAAGRVGGDRRLRLAGHPRHRRRSTSGAAPWLVPVAQAMVALPLVVRTLVPDAARESTSGSARRPRRWARARCGCVRDVDLPAAWRPLLAATGFAFAVSLGEFGATSFLVRPDDPTLPVVIYQLIGRPGADSFGTGAGRVGPARRDDGRGAAGRRAVARRPSGSLLTCP